tara:strand:+ start:184 stop:396 length:213 start_codon:yes stop_codon:yes gene_type:complete
MLSLEQLQRINTYSNNCMIERIEELNYLIIYFTNLKIEEKVSIYTKELKYITNKLERQKKYIENENLGLD